MVDHKESEGYILVAWSQLLISRIAENRPTTYSSAKETPESPRLMGMDPSNHFPHDVREIRPYDGQDRQDRGGQLFRRSRNSDDWRVRLMDGAESCFRCAAAAALAARAEIKAGALVSAAGKSAAWG